MKHIKLFENFNSCYDMFDTSTISGISTLSELEKPLYYLISKRRMVKLIYISPIEYLKRIAKNFKLSYNDTINGSSVDKSKVREYSNKMKNGEIFPVIWYEKDRPSQEGRHRALASIELGCKEMPVIEFSDVSTEELLYFIKDKRDYSFEQMDEYFKDIGYNGISQLGFNDFKRFIGNN